jgi:hypothetical protein
MDYTSVRDLIARIQTVLSSRWAEDRSSPFGPFERCASGVRFEQLPPDDQREVLTDAPFWGWYDNEGMTRAELLLIIDNVLAGKPQDKWLEGVFEKAALESHKVKEPFDGINGGANVKPKTDDGKISLRDLRHGSQEQDSREQQQKAKSHDIER